MNGGPGAAPPSPLLKKDELPVSQAPRAKPEREDWAARAVK